MLELNIDTFLQQKRAASRSVDSGQLCYLLSHGLSLLSHGLSAELHAANGGFAVFDFTNEHFAGETHKQAVL